MSMVSSICVGSSAAEHGVNNPSVKPSVEAVQDSSGCCNTRPFEGTAETGGENRVDHIHGVGGSSPSLRPISKIRRFQLRWREPLGRPECPYLFRTMLNLGVVSFRLHDWKRSDDKRHFHDHPWPFLTFVLRGGYVDVSPAGRDVLRAGSVRYRRAEHQHYVDVGTGGALTLLITTAPVRNWGFWVKGKFKRPLRYFGKFGHPPCSEQ